MFCYLFFFFKQKTAYEMRISDWSSDVCSSDLRQSRIFHPEGVNDHEDADFPLCRRAARHRVRHHGCGRVRPGRGPDGRDRPRSPQLRPEHPDRSEEHTSELQSLMRISYAVFCLKKKKKNTKHTQ